MAHRFQGLIPEAAPGGVIGQDATGIGRAAHGEVGMKRAPRWCTDLLVAQVEAPAHIPVGYVGGQRWGVN